MKILMVCLGNICRSPLAEGILQHIVSQKGLNWEIDSAGTSSWHAGEKPHQSSIEIAKKHGIDISTQKSRVIIPSDLDYFDLVITMDASNFENVKQLSSHPDHISKLRCLLNYSYPNENKDVPDPYYTQNFPLVYNLIYEACEKLVQTFLKRTSTYSRKA